MSFRSCIVQYQYQQQYCISKRAFHIRHWTMSHIYVASASLNLFELTLHVSLAHTVIKQRHVLSSC